MKNIRRIRAVSRVTIEFLSPCCLGRGKESKDTDLPFITDANGLPVLPGSSIAGVLRAALLRYLELEKGKTPDEAQTYVDTWFGTSANIQKGHASRVSVTWAHIHDEHDQPVEGTLLQNTPSEFLRQLSAGDIRDHVRLDHRGTAEENGKFDQQVLFAGSRFTFDLEIASPSAEKTETLEVQKCLLRLLHDQTVRLGAHTRAGLGQFRIQRCQKGVFDLGQQDEFTRYCKHPVALNKPTNALELLSLKDLRPAFQQAQVVYELTLSPSSFFMVGSGEELFQEGQNTRSVAAPIRTRRVDWSGTDEVTGSLSQPHFVLPATGLKGAIAHRVAFHYNRHTGQTISRNTLTKLRNASEKERITLGGQAKQCLEKYTGSQNHAVKSLFGYARDNQTDEETATNNTQEGQPSKLLFEDVSLERYEGKQQLLTMICIDPFTAGVKTGGLFSQKPIKPQKKNASFSTQIILTDPACLEEEGFKQALENTFRDLCEGHLPLGGGAGKGYGHMLGTWKRLEDAQVKGA